MWWEILGRFWLTFSMTLALSGRSGYPPPPIWKLFAQGTLPPLMNVVQRATEVKLWKLCQGKKVGRKDRPKPWEKEPTKNMIKTISLPPLDIPVCISFCFSGTQAQWGGVWNICKYKRDLQTRRSELSIFVVVCVSVYASWKIVTLVASKEGSSNAPKTEARKKQANCKVLSDYVR